MIRGRSNEPIQLLKNKKGEKVKTATTKTKKEKKT